MGGDACHTHSPKAGQGMNAAFLDAQNLSWKMHLVESGFAKRSILDSYETERKHIAETLLNFDAKYAKLFSSRVPAADEVQSANKQGGSSSSGEENEFIKAFKENCEFTSGYGVTYQPNLFNWHASHPSARKSSLFLDYEKKHTALRTGRIMHPATVTRVVDANVVHLEQEIPMNGAFRIYVFAGDLSKTSAAVASFAKHSLDTKRPSYLSAHLRDDIEGVSYHERHTPHSHFFSFCTILACKHDQVNIDATLPDLLRRYRDHVYADDIWDQRVPDATAAAHAKMGLDQQSGGIVVVRPDGYVGFVVKLVEGRGTVDALDAYFDVFTEKSLGSEKEDGVQARL